MKKILLASQSPRRKELLSSLGFPFDVVAIQCEETFPNNLPVSEIAGYLSKKKADAYEQLSDNEVLITADTIVALNGEVLGKPVNESEAAEMLQKLSGKTHEVYTGITIKTIEKGFTKTDVAKVTFAEIDPKEMAYYIQSFKPFDKAGAYGIQEWLGMSKVTAIQGSFYTIMGLPTHLIYDLLKEIGN